MDSVVKIGIVGDLWIVLLMNGCAGDAVERIVLVNEQIEVFVKNVVHMKPVVGALGYLLMFGEL